MISWHLHGEGGRCGLTVGNQIRGGQPTASVGGGARVSRSDLGLCPSRRRARWCRLTRKTRPPRESRDAPPTNILRSPPTPAGDREHVEGARSPSGRAAEQVPGRRRPGASPAYALELTSLTTPLGSLTSDLRPRPEAPQTSHHTPLTSPHSGHVVCGHRDLRSQISDPEPPLGP